MEGVEGSRGEGQGREERGQCEGAVKIIHTWCTIIQIISDCEFTVDNIYVYQSRLEFQIQNKYALLLQVLYTYCNSHLYDMHTFPPQFYLIYLGHVLAYCFSW